MKDTHIDILYQNLEDIGVNVFSCPYPTMKCVVSPDGYMGVNSYNIETTAEERAVLIHEEGHFATDTFYEYDSPYTVRAHQENVASRYGFKKYFPPEKIQAAINDGNTEHWQLAEYFGVPVEYMDELISYYIDACGVQFCYDETHCIDDCSEPASPETLEKLKGIETSLYLPNITEAQAQSILQMAELLRQRCAKRQK